MASSSSSSSALSAQPRGVNEEERAAEHAAEHAAESAAERAADRAAQLAFERKQKWVGDGVV
jgi:hypothetical protein